MKFPKQLADYIQDQILEGSKVSSHSVNEDSVTLLVEPNGLDKFIVIAQWYEGMDTVSMVNITGGTFTLLKEYFDKQK